MRKIALALMLALAACERAGAPAPAPTAETVPEVLQLTCERFRDLSAVALASAYGHDNVADQTLPGAEGEEYTATVLYPNDPSRRLEIVWRDPTTRTQPAMLSARGETNVWTGPNGLAIAQTLEAVEAANGRPFELLGFGWEYGGWVSDWRNGAFAPAAACATRVRFAPSAETGAAIAGDGGYASDLPAMRAARPVVAEFGLTFDAGAPG